MIVVGVGLLRNEGLAINPSLRLLPTFVSVSGRVGVSDEDETSRANGDPLTSFAFASVKSHSQNPFEYYANQRNEEV
jgi:hypothetical protein